MLSSEMGLSENGSNVKKNVAAECELNVNSDIATLTKGVLCFNVCMYLASLVTL